ncbi:MAG: flagellar protein FlaG [Burkholderiales bacterium]|nr:flagellar protein FlaG [Burkholderiales bacterium]
MNLALGDLQLSPVTGKPVASEAVPKTAQAQVPAKVDPVAKAKPQEPTPQTSKKLTVDSTDMSYSVDSTASAFTIKITNKSTGEVIRKLDFKAFSPEVHLTSKLTGTLVDVTS